MPRPFETIDELLKSHASEPQDIPLVGYPELELTDFKEHTAKELDIYTDAAVASYMKAGLNPADPTQEKAPVVAVLAPSSLEIVVTILATNRLGWSLLFLSTRLSAPAYTRLLDMANCNTIIANPSFDTLVKEIRGKRSLKLVPMLAPSDYRNVTAPKFRRDYDSAKEGEKIAWIIHSSGSTGFPKPIFLSNSQCLANFAKNNSRRAFCTSPLFHSHGLMELFRSIYSKNTFFLGNYLYPVTRQNLIDAMRVVKPKLLCAVPYVLKLLAETDDGIEVLAKTELVLYGGSSCPDDLGDLLVEKGVNLVANYGATETGRIFTSFRPPGDKEWSYMRLLRPIADHVLMDEIAPGVFECVALDGLPSKGPSNSSQPLNSFRTRDLFTRHPDPNKSNFYKYLSRLDDRITLINGEKVLPIPIEGRIRQHQLVKEAAMFGVGRSFPGLLVFKSEQASGLTDDEYMTAVWPVIEATNATAETFSRIPKELVVVMSADTVYPKTDKGTFIRPQLYKKFGAAFDEAYENFEGGDAGTLQLNVPELESFLLRKFRDDINANLDSAEGDIFAAGVDSLQAMRMWGMIKKELDLGNRQGELSQNVVFEKGSVKNLAKHLYFLRTSEGEEVVDEVQIMRELIEKYSTFEKHKGGTVEKPEKNCVLITGTTGSLGTFILAALLKRNDISKVWTLVRAPDEASAFARVLSSLSQRGLHLLEAEKAKIVALPSDFSRADLGLSTTNFNTLTSTLTHIIHSAWAVNFNLGVQSFESQHIHGVFNLLNLCLNVRLPSPAKFFFCSSVSAAAGTPKPARIQESIIEDLNHAQKTGYGRSKCVTEHIVRNAMASTGMHARVFRIGQLTGDEATAAWNDTEAVPLMIRSAISTGALPALDETISWLPVDICATAIISLALSPSATPSHEDPNKVYHILNPRTFNFATDLLPALRSSALPAFETVSPREWLQKLRDSDPDPVRNPSKKLIGFWEGKYDSTAGDVGAGEVNNGEGDTKGLLFETEMTIKDCEALGRTPDLIKDKFIERVVKRWLEKWLEKGLV